MLKLNAEKLGKWYDGVDFENSHLVTTANHNADLGISGIILRKPNSAGSNGRVFSAVTINLTNGLAIFGSLYVDKALNGLTFGVTQTEPNAQNERYDINVRVPMSIQAQVLRFAMTKAVEVATQAPAKPAYKAPTQAPAQQYYQAPVQQQSAPVQEQHPAHNQAPVNPMNGQALTVEQMEYMVTNGQL